MGVVTALMALVKLPRGQRAAVTEVRPTSDLTAELPARLRELGFLDGEVVKVLALGPAGGPLAVRIGETTFAPAQRGLGPLVRDVVRGRHTAEWHEPVALGRDLAVLVDLRHGCRHRPRSGGCSRHCPRTRARATT